MIVDFVNEDLGTTIYTNVVSADGYEVDNLLHKIPPCTTDHGSASIDPGLSFTNIGRPKKSYRDGFMADYFVKPPVDIVVQFPCLVDIDDIIVNRRSGEKRLAEFIVLTGNAKPIFRAKKAKHDLLVSGCTKDGSARTSVESQNEVSKGETSLPNCVSSNMRSPHIYPCKYEPDLSQIELHRESLSVIHTIAKFSSRNCDADVVIFNNAKSNNRSSLHRSGRHSAQTLKCFSLQYLYGASHLIVRIFRTEGSTVPAVKKLEVWGRPSNQNNRTVNQHVYLLRKEFEEKCMKDLCASKEDHFEIKDLTHSDETQINKKGDEHGNIVSDTEVLNIPKDFIDPITFDIMVLPVLLPSGHTIDSVTLEKCIKEDERNGRTALDPFTGIPFSAQKKAVPNTALKLRLDNFFLQNSVYSANDKRIQQTSGVVSQCTGLVDRVLQNNKRKLVMGNETGSKKAKGSCLIDKASLGLGKEKTTKSSKDLPLIMESSAVRNADLIETVDLTKGLSHEEKLKDSLDNALQQFVKPIFKSQKHESMSEVCCSSCRLSGKDLISVFQLPCKHIMCRKCIKGSSNPNRCECCSKCFLNKEITRVHFSDYFQ